MMKGKNRSNITRKYCMMKRKEFFEEVVGLR